MKSVFDYLKKNLTIEDYANLVETWEVHRGADGEENIFDLQSYKDFHLFANRYTLGYALLCQKKNRFWFGGNNYADNFNNYIMYNYASNSHTIHKTPQPFPTDEHSARTLAISMIDDSYIYERPDLYDKFFDFNANYAPNNKSRHPLNYPLILQYFTLEICRNTEIISISDDSSFEDLLNEISNMAHEFTGQYSYTMFVTSFYDYMFHFIVEHFDEYLDSLKDVKDKFIDYIKNRPDYYSAEDFIKCLNA